MRGVGRTVLIAGDAGIGKSRLLAAFLAKARSSGAQVLHGQCIKAEARRPFGPFVDSLRGVTDVSRGPEPQTDALTDPDVRYRSLRSFASIFVDLTRRAPIVLAIDDLHWADEGTFELFPYLAKALQDRMALLVGTYRTDELHRLHPLRAILTELARARVADTVTVDRLSVDETREMISATLGLARAVPKELVRTIHERCEGNPFFTEEILKALVETKLLIHRDGGWHHVGRQGDLVLPSSVRDTLQDRFVGLSEDARAALRIAAVIGPSFEFALLRQMTRMSDEALTLALREAVEAQLVDESDSADLFRFRHALTRESVLADLISRERRLLHREVALALEERAGADKQSAAEELAYHYDEAGMPDQAFRYHDLAGRRAAGLFAFGQAHRHLARALELAPDGADLADLQLRFAQAAFRSGEGHQAMRAAEEARRAYEARGDVGRMGVVLSVLSGIHIYFGEADEATRLSEEAIRLLEPLGETAELAEAYRQRNFEDTLSNTFRTEDGFRGPAEWAARVAEIGRRLNRPDIQSDGLRQRGLGLVLDGKSEGVKDLESALALAYESGAPGLVFACRMALMSATTLLGRAPAERRRLYEDAVAHAHEHGYVGGLLSALEVEQAIASGDFDRALRVSRLLVPDSAASAEVGLRIALVDVARRGPEAMPDLDALRRRLMKGPPAWTSFAATSAQPLLLAENPRAALEHAELAVKPLTEGSWIWNLDVAVVLGVEAARRLSDRSLLDRWIGLAMHGAPAPIESRERQARRAYGGALLAEQTGDLDGAVRLAGLSVEMLAESQWPYVWTIARLRHAELLLGRTHPGDEGEARENLVATVAFWRRAGATWFLGRLATWARAHNLTVPPVARPSASAKTGLTRRERQVAGLVAEGFSNRQIAERLVISERTAESHVERIMDKLAVRNRAGIAARMGVAART
jgi:DNA-binding CsgD family transcriptional regulator